MRGMGERIGLAAARAHIADAFNAAVAMSYDLGGDETANVIDARERVFADLDKLEADQDRLKLALAACEALIAADGPGGNLNETKLDEAVGLAKQALGR